IFRPPPLYKPLLKHFPNTPHFQVILSEKKKKKKKKKRKKKGAYLYKFAEPGQGVIGIANV
ncbi:hypothetical protein ACOSB0_00235, partial [Candidatus Phytoplasma citri]